MVLKRVLWLILFSGLGLTLVGLGLLIPAHLRAVDSAHLERAGLNTRTLIEEGIQLVNMEKGGAAQLLSLVAQAGNFKDQDALAAAVTHFNTARPEVQIWGGADHYLEPLFQKDTTLARQPSQPIIAFIRQTENRQRVLQFLEATRRPTVVEILKIRRLTNTVYFPSVPSTSGRALDAVLVLTGLLLQGDRLTPALQEELMKLVAAANQNGDSQKLELVLLDLLSLGQRFDWTQLALFVSRIDDPGTLHRLAWLLRQNEAQAPLIFSAVWFGGQPAAVVDYLRRFPDTAPKDLSFSLAAGQGGLQELLKRQLRIHYPFALRQHVVDYEPMWTFYDLALRGCGLSAWAALIFKYLFFLAGGFCLARAWHQVRPTVSALEQPLVVPVMARARQGLWAVFFLVVMICLSEPFLVQESQSMEIPLRVRLPRVGVAVPGALTNASEPLMNQLSYFSLSLFFVLQALIYTVCLLKLSEIRRLGLGPRLKLRLLENEEHLFDAGLYLGFVGTIISLILMSMGIVKPSLMAGYSSTSFGIIFVSILKIFHVRPYRRNLILESENESTTP